MFDSRSLKVGLAFSNKNTYEQDVVQYAVFSVFNALGLDTSNYGREDWNPLGEVIKPGDRVVIKPNLVKHERGEVTHCVMTHAAVIKPIVDFCIKALKGEGKVTICDVPLQSADFELVKQQTGLDRLMEYYSKEYGDLVELVDLRIEKAISDENGFFVRMERNQHRDSDFVDVDLGSNSMLEPLTHGGNPNFAVDDYDIDELKKYHKPGVHRYLIPRKILEADVFINVPKLKTHQKAGITVALKNLIGINARKDRLPHFRKGLNGDEYYGKNLLKLINSEVRFFLQKRSRLLWTIGLKAWRQLVKLEKTLRGRNGNHGDAAQSLDIKHGAWWGNDTIWRTILDINRILFYANVHGELQPTPQRKYLCIVDGIIAGEGDGPINPIPKEAGVILGGFNPVLVDALAARIMGFDPFKIPQIRHAFDHHRFPLIEISKDDFYHLNVVSNNPEFNGMLFKTTQPHLNFEPAPGWKNKIELDSAVEAESVE